MAYSGPLDVVPGALCAYSHRAMSSAKRGTSLYTLREDAGDTTLVVSSDAVTGRPPLAAITTFLSGADGFVTSWTDQGVHAKPLVQATAATQPQWVADGPSGWPTTAFTAASSTIMSTASDFRLAFSSYTLFAVLKTTGTGGPALTFNILDDEDTYVRFLLSGAAGALEVDASTNEGAQAIDYTTADLQTVQGFMLLDVAWEFGGAVIHKNGQHVPWITNGDVGGPIHWMDVPLNIGKGFSFEGGSITELVFYNHYLSIPDRDNVRANIAAFYGI